MRILQDIGSRSCVPTRHPSRPLALLSMTISLLPGHGRKEADGGVAPEIVAIGLRPRYLGVVLKLVELLER